MTTARTLALSCALILASAVACSFVDPRAGAPQAACGLSFGGSNGSAAGTGYYGPSSGQPLGAATCAASTGSACDDCETTHCCATRSACYGDPVCACADLSLDECLDASETSPDEANALSRCWSTFAAKGTAEQARFSCLRSWCQSACAVP